MSFLGFLLRFIGLLFGSIFGQFSCLFIFLTPSYLLLSCLSNPTLPRSSPASSLLFFSCNLFSVMRTAHSPRLSFWISVCLQLRFWRKYSLGRMFPLSISANLPLLAHTHWLTHHPSLSTSIKQLSNSNTFETLILIISSVHTGGISVVSLFFFVLITSSPMVTLTKQLGVPLVLC